MPVDQHRVAGSFGRRSGNAYAVTLVVQVVRLHLPRRVTDRIRTGELAGHNRAQHASLLPSPSQVSDSNRAIIRTKDESPLVTWRAVLPRQDHPCSYVTGAPARL